MSDRRTEMCWVFVNRDRAWSTNTQYISVQVGTMA